MAEAVANQDTEILAKGPSVFNPGWLFGIAGSTDIFSTCVSAFTTNNGRINCWHRWISGLRIHAEAGPNNPICRIARVRKIIGFGRFKKCWC